MFKSPSQMFDVVLKSPLLYFYSNFIQSRSSFQEVFSFFRIWVIDVVHLPTLKSASFLRNISWWQLLPTIVSLCVIIALYPRSCLWSNLQVEKGLIHKGIFVCLNFLLKHFTIAMGLQAFLSFFSFLENVIP